MCFFPFLSPLFSFKLLVLFREKHGHQSRVSVFQHSKSTSKAWRLQRGQGEPRPASSSSHRRRLRRRRRAHFVQRRRRRNRGRRYFNLFGLIFIFIFSRNGWRRPFNFTATSFLTLPLCRPFSCQISSQRFLGNQISSTTRSSRAHRTKHLASRLGRRQTNRPVSDWCQTYQKTVFAPNC